MKQIKKDTLCYYCMGCCKLEQEEFNGVLRCEHFMAGIAEWQELLRKELKKK